MNIYDFKPNDQSHGHILEKLIIMIKVKMSSEAPVLEEPTRFGQRAAALGAAVQLVRIHIRDIIRDMISAGSKFYRALGNVDEMGPYG